MRTKDDELLAEICKKYPFILQEDINNFEKILKDFRPNTVSPFVITAYLSPDTYKNITSHIKSSTEKRFLIILICLTLGYHVYYIKSYNKDKADELESYEKNYLDGHFLIAGDIKHLMTSVNHWRDRVDVVGEYLEI